MWAVLAACSTDAAELRGVVWLGGQEKEGQGRSLADVRLLSDGVPRWYDLTWVDHNKSASKAPTHTMTFEFEIKEGTILFAVSLS